MRWHHSVTVINGGGATPDPVAAPLTVPAANCFRLPKRDPENDLPYQSFIIGLIAPTAESVNLELYALDDDDDSGGDMPPLVATARWYRVAVITALAGGRALAYEPFKGGGLRGVGGMFYLRVVSELVAANRVVRVGAAFGGGDADVGLDLRMVNGVAVATAAPGSVPVSEVLQNISGPTLCWSAVAPGLGPGVLAAVPCAESLAAANRWHAIPAGCRFVRFTAVLSGAGLPAGVVLQPMYSPDAGVTAKPIPLVKTVTNRVFTSELINEVQGADGAATRADGWLPPLLVPREEIPANATHVELRAAKNGGGGGTSLLGYVAFEG